MSIESAHRSSAEWSWGISPSHLTLLYLSFSLSHSLSCLFLSIYIYLFLLFSLSPSFAPLFSLSLGLDECCKIEWAPIIQALSLENLSLASFSEMLKWLAYSKNKSTALQCLKFKFKSFYFTLTYDRNVAHVESLNWTLIKAKNQIDFSLQQMLLETEGKKEQ